MCLTIRNAIRKFNSMKMIQPIKPLRTAILSLLAIMTIGRAQLIIPEITIDAQRLPQEAKVFQQQAELDTILTAYFGDKRQEWNRDDEKYDLPVQISIYLTDYTANPQEDKYKANLIITNKRETRFDDKRWEFGLVPPFQFQSAQYHALTSVIEFYVWMLIGIEEDKFEKFGGDRFYDRARQVSLNSSKSLYYFGWDKRSELLREYTGDDNDTFRELNFYYYTGIFYDEEQNYEQSEIYLRYALIKLEKIAIDRRQQFLESNHLDFAAAIANAGTGRDEQAQIRVGEGIQSLIRMDPARRELYETYLPKSEGE
jgi:hypothetical protein